MQQILGKSSLGGPGPQELGRGNDAPGSAFYNMFGDKKSESNLDDGVGSSQSACGQACISRQSSNGSSPGSSVDKLARMSRMSTNSQRDEAGLRRVAGRIWNKRDSGIWNWGTWF